MIKWYHLILTLIIGIGIGYFIPKESGALNGTVIDPQIHRLNAEIGWRQLKERKIKDSLKIERKEKVILAKENIELRTIANRAISRYKQASNAIPLTRGDTIVFLMRDTLMCDSALLRSQDLIQGLTKEIINDNKEIETLDSLNSNLEMDKRDLQKIDTLHQEKEKKLIKSGRKKFLKGLGIGGILGIMLAFIL